MDSLHPLGDQAVLAYLPDEAAANRFAAAARSAQLPGCVDVVQAYASVAVHFDLNRVSFGAIHEKLKALELSPETQSDSRLIEIPCCYELGLDLERVSQHTGLGADDVIRLHSGMEYTVYAIGFCPGFPYLGYLPAELSGVPRLPSPRLRVDPGSVGLTGRQTGLYPLERPGGWNLVGRTPLEMVNVADGYFPLRVGDRVRFRAIANEEFVRLKDRRLFTNR